MERVDQVAAFCNQWVQNLMSVTLTCSCGLQNVATAPVWEVNVNCLSCGRRLSLHDLGNTNSVVIESEPYTQNAFCFPDRTSNNLILLGEDSLQFGAFKNDELHTWIESLWDEDVFADLSSLRQIEYRSIRDIECNLWQTIVTIHIESGDSWRSEVMDFHDGQSCRRFLDFMAGSLNYGWLNNVRFYSRFRAALFPAIGFIVLSALFGLAIWASTVPEFDLSDANVHLRRRTIVLYLLVAVLACLGWRGMAILFGTLSMLTLQWMVFRLIWPPIKWTLKRNSLDSPTVTPVLNSMESKPVAWIVRDRSSNDAANDSTPGQSASSSKRSRIGGLTWGIVAFVVFGAGYLLVLSDLLARIANVFFLCVHSASFLFLFSRICVLAYRWVAATNREMSLSFLSRIFPTVFGTLFLAAMSAAVLAINPSDHRIVSAIATGISLVGALFELWFAKTSIARLRKQ